jgi:hypothetical protein
MNISKTDCENFLANTEYNSKGQLCHRNPVTKRLVMKNGTVYKNIFKYCDSTYFVDDKKTRQSPEPKARQSPEPKARQSPEPKARQSPEPKARQSPEPKARQYDDIMDRIDKKVKAFIQNPYINPKTNKPMELDLRRNSEYFHFYSLAYASYTYDEKDNVRPSSEIIKKLPKRHLLFNNKLDILYYEKDRSYAGENDEVYNEIASIFNTTTLHAKDKKFLKEHSRNEIEYNEKFVVYVLVQKFIFALVEYLEYMLDDKIAQNKFLFSRKTYILFIFKFINLFKTYHVFIEILNDIGKKEYNYYTHVKSKISYNDLYKALFKNSENVVKTLIDMCENEAKYLPIIKNLVKHAKT